MKKVCSIQLRMQLSKDSTVYFWVYFANRMWELSFKDLPGTCVISYAHIFNKWVPLCQNSSNQCLCFWAVLYIQQVTAPFSFRWKKWLSNILLTILTLCTVKQKVYFSNKFAWKQIECFFFLVSLFLSTFITSRLIIFNFFYKTKKRSQKSRIFGLFSFFPFHLFLFKLIFYFVPWKNSSFTSKKKLKTRNTQLFSYDDWAFKS